MPFPRKKPSRPPKRRGRPRLSREATVGNSITLTPSEWKEAERLGEGLGVTAGIRKALELAANK